MSLTGPWGKEEFTAEKPFVVLGWPDQHEVREFETEEELLRFIATTGDQDQSVFLGQAIEYKDGKWEPVNLPGKD